MLSLQACTHIDRLPGRQDRSFYKRLRWQVFFGIFRLCWLLPGTEKLQLGDALLIEQGFSRGDLGLALPGSPSPTASPSSWMGNVSDRSNARYFRRPAALGRHHVHDGHHALGHLQHRHHVRAACS